MIAAAMNGDLSKIIQLLEAGASIDFKDQEGRTALMKAAMSGHLEVMRLLLKAGAKIDMQDKYKDSALILATILDKPESVRLLLETGADFNLKNKDGSTAMSLSEKENNDKISDLIIKYKNIRENIKKLEGLQKNGASYFSRIPKDLIYLIKIQLKIENI